LEIKSKLIAKNIEPIIHIGSPRPKRVSEGTVVKKAIGTTKVKKKR
jgi:hypothetical protein